MNNFDGIMHFLMPEPTWRWDHFTNDYDELTVGDGQWALIKEKLVIAARDLIKEIYCDHEIEISAPEKGNFPDSNDNNFNGALEKIVDHYRYTFNFSFDDSFYTIKIDNIPDYIDPYYSETFFNAIVQYLSNAYCSLEKNIELHKSGYRLGSWKLMKLADAFLLNFSRTVMFEYLYDSLNKFRVKLSENAYTYRNSNRFNMELIRNAIDFAIELSTRKIENKEIQTGFVFHKSENDLIQNSIVRIKFENPIEFGEFKKIKSLIPSTNGTEIFFNVTNKKITHIFQTKKRVSEISMDMFDDGKKFEAAPFIISIQGAGKIVLLHGNPEKNITLLHINHGKPMLRDLLSIMCRIKNYLNEEFEDDALSETFAKWILGIPEKKKGTTIVIGDFDRKLLKNILVKANMIKLSGRSPFKSSNFNLLDKLACPDGAIIFNKSSELLFTGAILPFQHRQSIDGGGSRHQSAINFTEEFKCLAVAISEDGNISVIKNGCVKCVY